MAVKLEGLQPEGKVVTKGPDGVEHEKAIPVKEGDGIYAQPTINVGLKCGITQNLGNYNSMRIDVSLFLPCYPSEVEDAWAVAKEWVEKHLQEAVDQFVESGS